MNLKNDFSVLAWNNSHSKRTTDFREVSHYGTIRCMNPFSSSKSYGKYFGEPYVGFISCETVSYRNSCCCLLESSTYPINEKNLWRGKGCDKGAVIFFFFQTFFFCFFLLLLFFFFQRHGIVSFHNNYFLQPFLLD